MVPLKLTVFITVLSFTLCGNNAIDVDPDVDTAVNPDVKPDLDTDVDANYNDEYVSDSPVSAGNTVEKDELKLGAQISSAMAYTNSSGCPYGFVHVSTDRITWTQDCYMASGRTLRYNDASETCRRLTPTSNLAVVTNPFDHSILQAYLQGIDGRGAFSSCSGIYWIGLSRLDQSTCRSRFVWKTRYGLAPLVFNAFAPGEPNCGTNIESCVHYWSYQQYDWNDSYCSLPRCSICQTVGLVN